MTLEDIAAELPNGFHDAFLRRLTIDYADRRATPVLNVWVGDVAATTDAEREAYRPVTITISSLLWCIIESPRAERDGDADGLWIDAGPVSSLKSKPAIPTVPDDAFAWWTFVRERNAFIYIAGTDASLDS
jgi:hypothetical protein